MRQPSNAWSRTEPTPNSADEAGGTPLHFACQEWSVSGARRLIAFGAKVDPADDHGNTPLWRAVFASRGRGDLIGVLLAAGANPDAPNEAGITPRQLSERIGNYDVRSFFDKQPD